MPEMLDGRAKSIIDRAIDLEGRDRINFLERECAGDLELGRRVESLLTAMEKDDAFLQEPTVSIPSTLHAPLGSERPGERIGPYTLVELIGEGGFGSVYLADQSEPVRRRVALKIIKLGMDTRQVIARFEAERQALAMMDHPNIARVLEAGATAAGRPYFVMELVRGETVTAYCDRQQLSIHERLELFREICGAVQHAHQKGVIHRDLKPSNVLVTQLDGRPVPKVIDFGIAKATAGRLTDATLQTELHQLVGTPEYMSPEQADPSRTDIDTRSDVYSLGVLLYELLTGDAPFDRRRLRSAPILEVQRILREEEPARPSNRLATWSAPSGQFRLTTPVAMLKPRSSLIEIAERRRTDPHPLTRALRGDLDWIVLKCLEKDRARRYETASALADDIGRHLAHEPVIAMPPTAGYRFRKFTRRYWAPLTVAAGFLLVLIMSTAVAWRLYGAAELAHGMAAEQAAKATGRLWQSLLAQARAGRSSMLPGRRFNGLEAIRQAAAIRPAAELRDEAIACMALPDVAPVKTFSNVPDASAYGLRNPDRFAHVSADGDIHVIAVEDGRELRRLKGQAHLHVHLGFSPDGQFLFINYTVSVGKFLVEVWNLDAPLPLITLKSATVDPVYAFSPTSEWIAILNPDLMVHFYRLPTGDEFKSLAFGPELYRMQTHPGGSLLAVAATAPPYLRVWDIVNDRLVSEFDMPTMAGPPEWSHDGRLLAAAGGDTEHWQFYVWDFKTMQLHSQFAGHQGMVTSVYFHPHADLLASQGWDFTSRFWDLRAQREVLGSLHGWFVQGFGDIFACSGAPNEFAIWRFEPARELMRLWAPSAFGLVGTVRFAPGGECLISATTNGVRLWDVESGRHSAALDDHVAVWAEMLPDRRAILAATNEGLVRYSHLSDGTLSKGGEPELLWPQKDVRGCCLSPKDQTAIVSLPSELVFVDYGTGQERRRLPGFAGMRKVSLSPTGRWIFVNNWKGSCGRIWDVESGEVVRGFEGRSVTGLFSPDGRWLLVSNGPEFLLCECGSWNVVRRVQRLHPDTVAGTAAFSNDGTMVALAQTRYEIQLMNLTTGEVLATLPNPDQYGLLDLRFSPDDRWLAAATVDRLIEAWDIARLRSNLRTLGLDW